jgi:hypothetical protein
VKKKKELVSICCWELATGRELKAGRRENTTVLPLQEKPSPGLGLGIENIHNVLKVSIGENSASQKKGRIP